LSNAIEDTLTSLGVTYAGTNGPEEDLLPLLHNKLFNNSLDVVGIRIAIPDNSINPYHLFIPPQSLCVQRILNASYDRIYEDDVTFAETSAYTSITPTSATEYTVYKHGNGFLFKTEDTAYNADLECMITNKTNTNLDDELRLVFLYAYYYLYTNDRDKVYNYIRRISNMKTNTVNQRHTELHIRRLPIGQITPYEL